MLQAKFTFKCYCLFRKNKGRKERLKITFNMTKTQILSNECSKNIITTALFTRERVALLHWVFSVSEIDAVFAFKFAPSNALTHLCQSPATSFITARVYQLRCTALPSIKQLNTLLTQRDTALRVSAHKSCPYDGVTISCRIPKWLLCEWVKVHYAVLYVHAILFFSTPRARYYI